MQLNIAGSRLFPRASCLLALALLAPLAARAVEAGEFFFRDGDRVMILGDSITEQGWYSTFIESYVVSRFPRWKISFRNTGWSGDTMDLRARNGIAAGVNRDLLPLAPTAVTIDFGMNDARAGDSGYAAYIASARKLGDKLAAAGSRIALVTPSPEEKFQADQPAGSAYNVLLRKYSEGLQQVAREKQWLFIDQLNPMIQVIEDGRAAGVLALQSGGVRLVSDNVHPNPAGGLVMATNILKGLNAPALVSSVEIDAATGAVKAEQAEVSEVKTGATMSFTRLDASMPWPVPASVGPVLKVPGFAPFDALSLYTLKVTGLTAARYDVAADGKSLGAYTKEELAAGVNLSAAARLVFPETKALIDAIMVKNDRFFSRWRVVQLAVIPSWVPADAVEKGRAQKLAELDAALAKAEAKVDSLRDPKPHVWTVKPAL